MQHVGVISFLHRRRPTSWIKRHALLFDAIVVTDLSLARWMEESGTYGKTETVNDIDYLKSVGFLRESHSYLSMGIALSTGKSVSPERDLRSFDPNLTALYQRSREEFSQAFNRQSDIWKKINKARKVDTRIELMNEANQQQYRALALSTRLAALDLRLFEATAAVSLEPFETLFGGNAIDRPAAIGDLYEIVVDNLPIPEERVPWEDIFRFSQDHASQQRLRALRLWLGDLAKNKLTYGEAVDRIAYLIEEFRRHMKGAGVKSVNSVVKTFLVGSAELAEAAIKFKLKTLAEAPFKLFETRADLVEAERKSPGSELAYVVRAIDEFA